MTIAELFTHKRVQEAGARKTAEETVAAERTALLHLALLAALSSLIWYLSLVRPYGLSSLWFMRQLDLDRLAPVDPSARWLITGGLIAQGVIYFLAYRIVQRVQHRRLAWAIVILGALAASIVLLFFYPLGSTDIWDYIVHGRMLGIYNANPFVRVAAQYPQDTLAWYAGWPYDTSAYGPFWEVLAALTARLAGNGVIQNVIAFKVLSGLFLAASAATIAVILRRKAPDKALTGVLLLAWNPVVLYETMANGHNDIVMMFWVLVAAHMLLERRYTFAILSLVAGALVKFIPLLMVPAAGLIALRELRTWKARALFVGVTAVAALGLIVVAYEPFWAGPQILGMARRQEMFTSTLAAALVAIRFPQIGWIEATREISKIASLLTAGYALFEAFRAMADRSWTSFTRSSFNILMFYLLVTNLWFWPWYAVWALALMPLLPPGYAFELAHVFAVAAMTKPLIFAPLYAWKQPPEHDWAWQQLRLGPSVLILPWVYALTGLLATGVQFVRARLGGWRAEPAATPAYAVVSADEQPEGRMSRR